MKYYSELTTEMYDTIEELDAAECEHKRQVAELEAAHKEKERARAEVDEAVKKATDLIKEYVREYGIYSYNGQLINGHKFWPIW